MLRAESTTPRGHGPSPRFRGRLVAITALLGILTVIHDVDHVRQGRALHPMLYAVGFAAFVSIGITLAVLVRRPRFAKPVAIAQGIATVVGVGVVHAAPRWSNVTDSYVDANADALSWSIIITMMCAGVVLAVGAANADG